MKVKKFSNLWTMGLIISASLLVGVYIVKLCFPEWYIEIAYSKQICEIGHYIDGHKWAWLLTNFIISLIAFYFYCCACCGKTKLNYKEIIIIIIAIIFLYTIKQHFNIYYITFNYIVLIILPIIFKCKNKNFLIVFVSTQLVQIFSLEIRSIGLMISDFNIASALILLIDYYIAQILLYFYFNYKKED